MRASDNPFPSLLLPGQADPPASPAAGRLRLFVRASDLALCTVDADGEVAPVWATLPLSARGDLLVRGAGALDRLPAGADGQVLASDSGAALGLRWADAAVGGGGGLPWTTRGDTVFIAGGRDLAHLFGTATANGGVAYGEGPERAIDGEDLTRYGADSDTIPKWVAVDLGEARAVGGVRVRQAGDRDTWPLIANGPADWAVDCSDDGTTWTEVRAWDSATSDTGPVALDAPVTARHWRLRAEDAPRSWCVWTLSLLEAVAPARLPAGAAGQVMSIGGSGLPVWAAPPYQAPVQLSLPWSADALDGILNALGQNAAGWSNPAGSAVAVAQSSDQDATRTADKATDHSVDANHESHTQGGAGEWWRVDFGAWRRVAPTRIGIRGRGAGGYHPRSFTLQGSSDLSAWTDLLSVSGAGPSDGTWWSSAVTDAGAWRSLRILQTGANSSGDAHLVLGEVEVWGSYGPAAG